MLNLNIENLQKFEDTPDERIAIGEYDKETSTLCLSYSNRQKSWVSKITGTDPKYKLARTFIDASETGGTYKIWKLDEGAVYGWYGDKRWGKKYGAVVDGELYIMTEEQATEYAESL